MKKKNLKPSAKRVWNLFPLLILAGILVLTLEFCGDPGSAGPADGTSLQAPAGNGMEISSSGVTSRSYNGHHADKFDINNFVSVYPKKVGTRLDDCQTCHLNRNVTQGGKSVYKNTCDYCHLYVHPDPTVTAGAPATITDTLNPYGVDYKNAGRSKAAIRNIASTDSDGDTYSNVQEIKALRYPGDATSMPGQPWAPVKILHWKKITSLPKSSHLQLSNANKQPYDEYAYYTGVTFKKLLTSIGVNLAAGTSVTGITVIAPDGFTKDFTLAQINNQYADGLFYPGLDSGTLGPDCGFVMYPPSQFTTGLGWGSSLPNQWLILAYRRDGGRLDPSYLDPANFRIDGEGPYRIIVPQTTPGTPDRGLSYSPTACGDSYDYLGSKDHNAGSMVKGVIAIRINPMPAGYEQFDYQNGGWAYIDAKELIIYGFGINP